MAAVGGSLTYTQHLMLDRRWNNVGQTPKHLQEADAERIRIEQKALELTCQSPRNTRTTK